MNIATVVDDYHRVESALRYLHENRHAQPDLQELANHLGISEFHMQRVFTRWAGVSPKRFLQFLGANAARPLLRQQRPVLDVAHEIGLSGGGRLHDLIINTMAVTPGELARHGAGMHIQYGFHPSPFGDCLIALSPRGICHLAFSEAAQHPAAFAELRETWQDAELVQTPKETAAMVRRIFAPLQQNAAPLALLLRGTNFQICVWEALLRIPEGSVISYGELASTIGKPSASRAVGQAVGRNAIAYLIPCHRVIRGLGEVGGYRWGSTRKLAMLGREAAHTGHYVQSA